VQGAASTYVVAALLGAGFVWLLVPLEVLLGTGAVWQAPPADLAQNLTGHLAIQKEPWQWPPLLARALRWPEGVSIALTDSNPLFSLLAKLVAGVTGQPVNLFGAWLGLCLVLQPAAAVFVARSLGARSLAAALAVAVMALSFPALLARIAHENLGHINLVGHFLVLLGLGWSIRMVSGGGGQWWHAAVLATVTIFIHPFLFVLLCPLFAAPVIACALAWRGVACAVAGFMASTALPYGLFAILAGVTGGGDYGYGHYSMNLASPFWPQRSGVFGPDLPVIDATTGQYEGLTYLGAGGLLLLGVAVGLLVSGRATLPPWRVWIGHAAVLVVLTGMAVTHKAYLGPWPVVSIDAYIVERVMGPVRASGRLFWPVAYLLAIVPLAIVAQRVRQPWAMAVLAIAALLQWVDAAPLRAAVHAYVTTGVDRSDSAGLPARTTLLTAVSFCGAPSLPTGPYDLLRLDAIRAGIALSDVRVSREPAQRSCEVGTSDALELQLRPGEVRAFVGDRVLASLRSELLGPGTRCRRGETMMMCALDPTTGWEVAPPGAAVLPLRPGQVAEGGTLAPFLGWGWVRDPDSRYWSNGPRAVLLFRMPALPDGAKLRMQLEAEGIGAREGRPNRVLASAGPNVWSAALQARQELALADAQVAPITLEIAPVGEPGSIVRVVIQIPEPVDPRVRGTPMPVRWAGIRLHRLTVLPGDPAAP
jgi:hypothetical protein